MWITGIEQRLRGKLGRRQLRESTKATILVNERCASKGESGHFYAHTPAPFLAKILSDIYRTLEKSRFYFIKSISDIMNVRLKRLQRVNR